MKSQIMFSKAIQPERAEAMGNSFNFQEVKEIGIYLGVPLVDGRIKMQYLGHL